MKKHLALILFIAALFAMPLVCGQANAAWLMVDDDGNLVHFPPTQNRSIPCMVFPMY